MIDTLSRLVVPYSCCLCNKVITLADVFAGRVGSGIWNGVPSLAHKKCIEEFRG